MTTEDGVLPISSALAAGIALQHYGVAGSVERLPSEVDDVFRLSGIDGKLRLLRISAIRRPLFAGGESAQYPSLETAILLHLNSNAAELPVQRVITTLAGRPEVSVPATRSPFSSVGDDREPLRLVRMTSWLDGELLTEQPSSIALRHEIGFTLARLNRALRGFAHADARRTHQWDLQNFGTLRPLLDELPESAVLPCVARAIPIANLRAFRLRDALQDCLDRFDQAVRPKLANRAAQVIHSDFHRGNLLTDGLHITGILDFGDALAGPVAMDVGVAACYQLGATGSVEDMLAPALDVAVGYHAIDPLPIADVNLAADFMMARLATRIIVSQVSAGRNSENRGYLLRRTPEAIIQLMALRALPPAEISRRWRAACNLEVNS